MNERMMIKKRNGMQLGILFSLLCTVCIANGESRTFLRPRSAIEDVSLYLGLNNYNIYRTFYGPQNDNEKTETIFIAAGLFFEKSTNGDKLAEYFLPNNKSCVSIKKMVQETSVHCGLN